jgi:hypothetical protein
LKLYDLDAEVYVLGSILIDNEALPLLRDIIRPTDFGTERHRTIYTAMVDMREDGVPIDPITLCDHLGGELEKLGGPEYIYSLADKIGTSANILHYAQIIWEYSKKAQAIKTLQEAVKKLQQASSESVEEALGASIENLSSLTSGARPDAKNSQSKIEIISASAWLENEPPVPDQIIVDLFDRGDKLAIIGQSKMRKSFFAQQMALSLSSGRPFLSWEVARMRRVLYTQFEIKEVHFHHRIRRMASALGISAADLGDRLQVINARGLGISGTAGIERILQEALRITPDVILFDPLYKLATGIENAAEDAKIILNAFDQLAEQTGAAIAYVHHDAKGAAGDRDIRDRGAGSNVLGRDYDACITLTAHAQDTEAAIVEVLLRNYPPREPFSIVWEADGNWGYSFKERTDLAPEKKTSKTKANLPPLASYLPFSEAILGDRDMEISGFKAEFKKRTSLSDHRIKEFLRWASSMEDPYIITKSYRAHGLNKKWVKIGRHFDEN